MELSSNSLLVGLLSICALPLFLLSIVVFAVLITRSRIKEGKQMRKKLEDGAYDHLINNKKTFIRIRILAISSLIVISVMFIVFLFIVSKPFMLITPDSGKWLYIIMIGLPLACSVPASIFALLYAYRITK